MRLLHWLQAKFPKRNQVFRSKYLKPFERYFGSLDYWHFHRTNVAKAVAIGLFCGLMPGPTQMLSALAVAYILRANLPVALFTTLYSNPLTYIPLYYLGYRIGLRILEGSSAAATHPSLQEMSHWNWDQMLSWFSDVLNYLLVGIPILGIFLAASGYLLVIAAFRLYYYLEKHSSTE
ncbi:MAG: DUF2062 domain-containing protein [Neisseriaceae bacterium]